MLTVHHLAQSQSERIVWLCEELGLPYALVRYERVPPGGMAPPEYKALHPFGTAPIITDGDLVLGESGAIVEYLCRRHGGGGGLVPRPDDAGFVDYLYWFHFANGSLVPSIMLEMFGSPGVDPAGSRMARALAMIEDRLGAARFFAGDAFTAADIMMCLPRFFATRDLGPYPAIRAYLARIAERPAAARALAKAEPDAPAASG